MTHLLVLGAIEQNHPKTRLPTPKTRFYSGAAQNNALAHAQTTYCRAFGSDILQNASARGVFGRTNSNKLDLIYPKRALK